MSKRKIETVGSYSIYKDSELNEYSVRSPNGRECETYYTDDKQDAFDTANSLVAADKALKVMADNFDKAAALYN